MTKSITCYVYTGGVYVAERERKHLQQGYRI